MIAVKMLVIVLTVTIGLFVFSQSCLSATSFDKGINQITDILIQGLNKHKNINTNYTIAVTDFITKDNKKTELSKYIAENIIIDLTNKAQNNFMVLERQRLNSVLEEHNLMTDGVLKGDEAKKIGELLDANAIVLGNYYNLEDSVHIMVKLVSVSTGKIYSATKLTLNKNEIIYNILNERYLANMYYIRGGDLPWGDTGQEVNNFALNKYEVTIKEYINFLNSNNVKPNGQYKGNTLINIDDPENSISYKDNEFYFKASNYSKNNKSPVIYVTWWGAIEYCNWLSERSNLPKAYNSKGQLLDHNGNVTNNVDEVVGYRLPTDSEWEYAARGGDMQKETQAGLNKTSWYWRNSGRKYLSGNWSAEKISNNGGRTHAVGLKKSNNFNLYDMLGNVWEWTNTKGSSVFIVRGGSWFDSIKYCNFNAREYISPEKSYNKLGFRIARTK